MKRASFSCHSLSRQQALHRREAIHWAIHHAEKDDIIVLAGKGHEDYQILAGGVKIHFDEREVVADALKELEAEGR